MSSGECVFGWPGDVFVVSALMREAAVEDADEAVGEGPEGLVVGDATVTLTVVERPGTSDPISFPR